MTEYADKVKVEIPRDAISKIAAQLEKQVEEDSEWVSLFRTQKTTNHS